MAFLSYRQHQLADNWDAIVIGSGIGGLTAAALLSRHARKRVLVLERHYTAGGYTHTFHRPGYEWDVGVHYIGQVRNASFAVRRAFDHITDGRLEWAPMPDIYDRVLVNGRTYDFPMGLERFRSRMQEYFPRDAAAIDRYIAALQSCDRASGMYFAEKAVPSVMARLAGGLMRGAYLRWANQTTAQVLSEITNNQELIGVLTAQWGDYGLPPGQSSFGIHAMIARHYFEGADYPVGGASRIAATIAPLIEENGGMIVVSAEAESVILQGEKAIGVRMADGREFRAGIVISDAGARNTFERLVPQTAQVADGIREQLHSIAPSMAHLSLYVGAKKTAGQLGIEGTNLWVLPSYDHDANLARYAADMSAPFPVLFISFPSAKDPDFERRHPGRSTVEVVTLARYDWFQKWHGTAWHRRGPDYEACKRELAARLQTELERYVPALAGEIDYAELSTPLSTRHFTNHACGEAYGLSATPERFRLRCLRPQTPVRNLYLTGQDVVSLGVTGALFGGMVAASAIIGRNLVAKVTKPARSAAKYPRRSRSTAAPIAT